LRMQGNLTNYMFVLLSLLGLGMASKWTVVTPDERIDVDLSENKFVVSSLGKARVSDLYFDIVLMDADGNDLQTVTFVTGSTSVDPWWKIGECMLDRLVLGEDLFYPVGVWDMYSVWKVNNRLMVEFNGNVLGGQCIYPGETEGISCNVDPENPNLSFPEWETVWNTEITAVKLARVSGPVATYAISPLTEEQKTQCGGVPDDSAGDNDYVKPSSSMISTPAVLMVFTAILMQM